MASYTREYNIEWEQLAPSLQQKYTDMLTNAIDLDTSINQTSDDLTNINYLISTFYNKYEELDRSINKAIEEVNTLLDTTIKKLDKLTNEGDIETAVQSAFPGQYAKINSTKDGIIASDNFYDIMVTDNQEDKAEMQGIAVKLEDIVGDWYKFAHMDIAKTSDIDSANNIRNDGVFKDHSNHIVEPEFVTGFCQNNRVFSACDKWYIHYEADIGNGNQTYSVSEALLYDSSECRKAWSFNTDTGTISCSRDGLCTSGIVDLNEYKNYFEIKVRVDTNLEDGNFGILVGFCIVENEDLQLYEEHTLSIVRANGRRQSGSPTNKLYWALVYDLGYRSQYILTPEINTATGVASSRSNRYCTIRVAKRGNRISAYTSNFSTSKTPLENANLNLGFTLPKSKPDDWSYDMYKNIKTMLKRSRIGFITRSNKTDFTLISQSHALGCDNLLVCLDENSVYSFVDNKWSKVGAIKDYITPRTFLYNKQTKKIFFYLNDDKYRRV